jgi:hypothetical protein
LAAKPRRRRSGWPWCSRRPQLNGMTEKGED